LNTTRLIPIQLPLASANRPGSSPTNGTLVPNISCIYFILSLQEEIGKATPDESFNILITFETAI
jgi:hypothetical protein